MPQQIFISHSSEDRDLLEKLDSVFGKAPVKQYRASFEDQSLSVSQDLKSEIQDSVAMFVVLGKRAQSKSHTMIWIGWEAGIALSSGIPIWILEDTQSNVTEPIPSFTDYVLWDSSDGKQQKLMRDIIEDEFVGLDSIEDPFLISNSGDGEQVNVETKDSTRFHVNSRNNARVSSSEVTNEARAVVCPYDDCGEEFRIRFRGPDEFNCPSCRQAIILSDEKDKGSSNHTYT